MTLRFPDATEAVARLAAGPLAAILPGLQTDVAAPDPAALITRARDADGLLLLRTRVDAATLAALPRLKALAFLSTGVASWVDLAAAAAAGVAVRGVRGYGDQSAAEHALALILSALRGVTAADRAMREGRWLDRGGGELAGSRLAVIGLGGTGRALAALGRALGCYVVGWNRTPSDAATILPLDECLATADIVSLHLALTPETISLIDRRRIALLRPGAVLVNTARRSNRRVGADRATSDRRHRGRARRLCLRAAAGLSAARTGERHADAAHRLEHCGRAAAAPRGRAARAAGGDRSGAIAIGSGDERRPAALQPANRDRRRVERSAKLHAPSITRSRIAWPVAASTEAERPESTQLGRFGPGESPVRGCMRTARLNRKRISRFSN